jgi:hypothetical protein
MQQLICDEKCVHVFHFFTLIRMSLIRTICMSLSFLIQSNHVPLHSSHVIGRRPTVTAVTTILIIFVFKSVVVAFLV